MAVIAPLGTTNNSINVSALLAFAKKYAPEMLVRFLNKAEFASHFPVETDVVNEKAYMKIAVNNIIKPYTGKIENAGDEIVYSQRKLSVSVGQSDIAIDPESVRGTPFVNDMLINLTQGKKVYHEGIILAQFLMQVLSQLNDYTFFKGDTSLPGTTTNKALLIADGLEKMILNCIAASASTDKLVPVVTPAFDAGSGWSSSFNDGNIIESFEAVDDSFSQAYKGFERTIFCSHAAFKNYKKLYKRRHHSDPTFEKFDKGSFGFIYLDDTGFKTKIAPATWLGNSSRLIDAIDGSIRIGTDVAGMTSSIDIQKIGYLFFYMMKMTFGVQIVDPEAVRINSLS